ncbi:hypothetical protein LWI28_011603 [Acer negundo]|uniref:FBD domain-containing protein n=1 Tax=Acer negundo TaxID=4023 RepID=A0AAD5IJ27_ACENE|nr:hypothetical protein LWI28_011603 [Acer negundo]
MSRRMDDMARHVSVQWLMCSVTDDIGILSCVAPWICFAIEHKVQNLEINAFYNTPDEEWLPIRLPQSILICKALVKLKLYSENCDFVFDIPDSVVCFPSLKILHFEAQHSNSNLMQKFFRSCPVLEELTIHVDIEHNENVLTFDITIPTLKTLEIHLESDWVGTQHGLIHKFVARARNLEQLYINDDTLASFVIDETPYISDASLDGCLTCFNMLAQYELSKDEASRTMVLLRAIKNTKFLSLSEGVMRVLILAFDGYLPTFPNLIRLGAGIDAYFGWKLLPHFLNNSPNLEVLCLKKEYCGHMPLERFTYFESENVPSCLLLHVEEIEMINMMGDFDELEVIRYLLKNSKVLKSFSVGFSKYIDPKIKKYLRNQISRFPMGSDLREVEFY